MQRRLLDAATVVVARDGYQQLTVERLIEAAGVSRPSFYQYFHNADDCVWSAYREHSERLSLNVAAAVAAHGRAEHALLNTLLDEAIQRPHTALLLMGEGLAGGARGMLERDALVARIARAMADSSPPSARLDFPLAILLGAVFRFLTMLLVAEAVTETVYEELLKWARTFERASATSSWSARLAPDLANEPCRPVLLGSPRRPCGTTRERIVHATTATIGRKGYHAATVADIVAGAGVSRRQFYNRFSSKADAFVAAYEQGFEQALAACAPVFFDSHQWPERVWQSALAGTGFFSREPAIAYLGFVECYSLGRDFAARVHATQLAFTLFLEEGFRQRPEAQSLPRASLAITAAAIAEIGFQASRRAPSLLMRRMQPLAVYIVLTPFIGAEEAGTFVAGKLAGRAADSPMVI